MNYNTLIEQIKKAALIDNKNRKDIRYKKAMAFLVRKGFLKTNSNFENYYQARIRIKDLIWAGLNVEPRILEVLPAAAARLPKAFIFDASKNTQTLQKVIIDLNENKEIGADFLKIPYLKIKVWMNLALNDKRTKMTQDKKIMRTFRLNPETVQKMELLKKKNGTTEAALIERLIEKEIL
jgi:hypothetical protein